MPLKSSFFILKAKPGSEAPYVRVRADRHGDVRGLGGFSQHRYSSHEYLQPHMSKLTLLSKIYWFYLFNVCGGPHVLLGNYTSMQRQQLTVNLGHRSLLSYIATVRVDAK